MISSASTKLFTSETRTFTHLILYSNTVNIPKERKQRGRVRKPPHLAQSKQN